MGEGEKEKMIEIGGEKKKIMKGNERTKVRTTKWMKKPRIGYDGLPTALVWICSSWIKSIPRPRTLTVEEATVIEQFVIPCTMHLTN